MEKSLSRGVLDLVFPPMCVFCSTPCRSKPCCQRCEALLPANTIACRRCASPLAAATDSDCARCQLRPPTFSAALAPLKYEFPIDMAIKSLKFRRKLFYLPLFGELMLTEIGLRFAAADSLVAVPLHRWRQALRGFNQALELASYISRHTGLPIARNIRRVRATETQSGLSAHQRRQNLQDAFRVSGRLAARRPLIVDDVMTTGETCNQLAGTLLSAGAERVYVLTIARAQPAA
jgi:ComF family protein